MAVAVSEAGSALQRLSEERAPDGLITRRQLDDLNLDLQRMADRLADAIPTLRDASWWVENQSRFTPDQAYDVIVKAGEERRGA